MFQVNHKLTKTMLPLLKSVILSTSRMTGSRHLLTKARPCSAAVVSKKLVFKKFGDPAEVVELVQEELSSPGEDEVLLEMLVAPMNPADINTIQGKYPVKPPLPGVPGNEGVGQVIAVGSRVTSLKQGDFVIPNIEAMGTWRSHLVTKECYLLQVPNDAPIVELSGLASNASTAYRLLKDFVQLNPGDSVIQNGANSAAGQNVIQLARNWKLKTVNVIRDRPDIKRVKDYLYQLGATQVYTEEELRVTDIFKCGKLPPPKLGLNSVGGKSATELMRQLAPKGTLVTYGGMSREPVTVSTAHLIFKDIVCRGYWMTRWTRQNRDSPERKQMLNELINSFKTCDLIAPEHRLVPITKFKNALTTKSDVKGFSGAKFILDFRP